MYLYSPVWIRSSSVLASVIWFGFQFSFQSSFDPVCCYFKLIKILLAIRSYTLPFWNQAVMHTLLMDNRPFHISEISQNITVTTPISCIKYYIDYIKYRFTYNMDPALHCTNPSQHFMVGPMQAQNGRVTSSTWVCPWVLCWPYLN